MEFTLLPIGQRTLPPNPEFNKGLATNFLNCFFEVDQASQQETTKAFCVKRPGVSSTVASQPSYSSGPGLGCFTAQPYTSTRVYYAVKRTGANVADIWFWDGSTTTGIANCTLPTYNRVNFVNVGLPDDTYTTAWTGGATLYVHKSGVVGSATPNGVGADLTRPAYLNNRVFVGDRVSGNIFQSSAGNYTTYSASEFVAVESYGGKLVDIARYNNYIVAFKEYSTEFFEDVANQNGSVLGRVSQAIQQVGCVHPNTIVDTGSGELLWVGTDESGYRSVCRLTNSFQLEKIEDDYLTKYLQFTASYDGSYAFLLNVCGHQFYVLTLKQNYTDPTNATDYANCTSVYDLKLKKWYTWNSTDQITVFIDSLDNSIITDGRWSFVGSCKSVFNTTYVQNYSNGALYQIDDSFYNDMGSSFTFAIRFNNIDFNVDKHKFINKISLRVYADYTSAPTFSFGLRHGLGTSLATTRTINTLTTNAQNSEFNYTILRIGRVKTFNFSLSSTSDTTFKIGAIVFNYDIGDGYGVS